MNSKPNDDRHDVVQVPRRTFVRNVARKAVYVPPAVMVLKAARPVAAGFPSCADAGSPCTFDADCCAGFDCLSPGMAPCMGEPDCTCDD